MTRSPAPRASTTPSRPTRRLRELLLAAVTMALLAGSWPAAASGATIPGGQGATASDAAAAALPGPQAVTGDVAVPAPGTIKLTQVAGGLTKPVLITSPNDGTGRQFIVEQTGRIKILQGGAVLGTPFLNLSRAVSTGGERGLLGLAFHPSFATNGKLYVDFTNRHGNTVVREYRVSGSNPNRVATGTARNILKIKQPYSNHNGGMLAFGPDGYLYIGTGDGGSAGDPGNRAQRKDTLLGKLLRIDINRRGATKAYRIPRSNPYVGKPGRNEIWQRGLRNPWRFSFDRSTGNLWIGDVGQSRYEEIDRARQTSSGAGRGVNWGWRVMEGFHCYRPATGCNRSGKRLPLLNYAHRHGRCSVTGGYVYRGAAIPALQGWYVFGDYCSGEIMTVPANASSKPSWTRLRGRGSGRLISSFGEDASGELYVVDLRGTVYRIDPA